MNYALEGAVKSHRWMRASVTLLACRECFGKRDRLAAERAASSGCSKRKTILRAFSLCIFAPAKLADARFQVLNFLFNRFFIFHGFDGSPDVTTIAHQRCLHNRHGTIIVLGS